MITQERADGSTPNGGAYSIVYYQDDDGQPADKTKATRVEIVEYDSRDNDIGRTYGILNASR